MAVRFDAGGDQLVRTTDLLNFNAAYTWMAWFYLASDRNTFTPLLVLNLNTFLTQDYVGTNGDGTTLTCDVWVDDVHTDVPGSALSPGTWYHVCVVRSSTTDIKVYLNGTLDITNTHDVGTRGSITRMGAGTEHDGGEHLDGRMAYSKAWSTNLTQSEIQQEMLTIRPHRMADLYGFWPILPGSGERARDYSGNGRDWTEGGSLVDEDPPPVSWGAGSWLPSALVVQRARPTADHTDGAWTNELGSQTNLYASVDEASASDADYIQSSESPTVVDECKLTLGALSDPAVGTGHVLRYRYKKSAVGGDQIDLAVRLYAADGSTVIASQAHANIDAVTDGVLTLSESEANAIPSADYASGLVVGFRAVKA